MFLNRIYHERNLNTFEAIGSFLELSPQQVSILLGGKHKSQRSTIAKIAKKFQIPIEKFQKELSL